MKVLMVDATGRYAHFVLAFKAAEIIPNPDMPGLPEGVAQRMEKMIAHYDGYGLPAAIPWSSKRSCGVNPGTLSDYFRELHTQEAKGE